MKPIYLVLITPLLFIGVQRTFALCTLDCANGCTDDQLQAQQLCLQNETKNLSVAKLYEKGITKYNTVESFRSDDLISRQEAAKFFSKVSDLFDVQPVPGSQCVFFDSATFDPTLALDIKNVCTKGIMKGGSSLFHPHDSLSIVQAFVILSRMIAGPLSEDAAPRYKNYIDTIHTPMPWIEGLKLLPGRQESDITLPITRGQMAELIYYVLTEQTASK